MNDMFVQAWFDLFDRLLREWHTDCSPNCQSSAILEQLERSTGTSFPYIMKLWHGTYFPLLGPNVWHGRMDVSSYPVLFRNGIWKENGFLPIYMTKTTDFGVPLWALCETSPPVYAQINTPSPRFIHCSLADFLARMLIMDSTFSRAAYLYVSTADAGALAAILASSLVQIPVSPCFDGELPCWSFCAPGLLVDCVGACITAACRNQDAIDRIQAIMNSAGFTLKTVPERFEHI